MSREVIPIPLDDLEEVHEAVEAVKEREPMDEFFAQIVGLPDREFFAALKAREYRTSEAAAERWLDDPEVNAAVHRRPSPPDFLDPNAMRKALK